MQLKIKEFGDNNAIAFILYSANKQSIVYLIKPDINKDMLSKEDVDSVMRYLKKKYNYIA